MTREEAIYQIKQLAVLSTDKEIPKITEALDMAIKALSEPSKVDFRTDKSANIGTEVNDLISREALMEYCSNQKSKTISNNDIARFPSAEQVTSKLESVEIPTVADEESTMSQPNSKLDLISRADAIEEIESAMKYDKSIVLIAGLACAKGIVASLPSADRPKEVRKSHGDLVDIEDIGKVLAELEKYEEITMQDIRHELWKLPTIIEAEENKMVKESADRPHEDISEDGTLKVNVTDGAKVKRVLVWGDNNFGGLYYPE